MYLMIDADDEVSLESKFYLVTIGQSAQELRYLRFIEAMAQAHNYYFRLYDDEASQFLQKIAASLSVPVYLMGLQMMPAAQLVRFLKQHHQTPPKPQVSAAQSDALSRCNSNYFFYRKNSVLRHAEAIKRKKPKAESVTLPG